MKLPVDGIIKLFTVVLYERVELATVFAPSTPSQPSSLYVVVRSLINKHQTRLDRLARDKHSSVFAPSTIKAIKVL
jgi:hypothetical protein